MKVKKKFQFEGIELKIVEREEKYMNSLDTITMIRVIAPNGGILPIQIRAKQTLKSIVQSAIESLESFKKLGADINLELTKPLKP